MITATIHKQTVRCIEQPTIRDVFYDQIGGFLYYPEGTDLQAVLFTLNLTAKDMRLLAAMKIDPR